MNMNTLKYTEFHPEYKCLVSICKCLHDYYSFKYKTDFLIKLDETRYLLIKYYLKTIYL